MPLLRNHTRWAAPRSHLQLRMANPEDSTFLAHAILQAGRSHLDKGYWDLAVDDDAEDRLDLIEMLTVLESRSSCHYSGFHIAEVNASPAGAATGYDPFAEGFVEAGQVLAEGFTFLQYTADQIRAAYARLEPFALCVPRFAHGAWVVEWVAVMQAHQGRGIAGRLLQAVLDSGHSRGYRQAQVVTYIGNDSAVALYQRLGFAVTEERRHPALEEAIGVPGMVLLSREI